MAGDLCTYVKLKLEVKVTTTSHMVASKGLLLYRSRYILQLILIPGK